MTLFIVINSFNSYSFNKNLADIPGHLDRPAMSAIFTSWDLYFQRGRISKILFEVVS